MQMTKADVLTARSGGNNITDFHVFVGHDHAVDEQLYQLPFLLKGCLGQPGLYTLAKILNRTDQASQFSLPINVGGQLLRLIVQSTQLLLQVLPPTLTLRVGQRNNIVQVGLGQALQLMFQTDLGLAQVFSTCLQLLRQPVPPCARCKA